MNEQLALVVPTLFWVLTAGTTFLPMRWSLLSFILISHIDITSATFDSATSVGIENAVRTIALPTLLFIRFSRGRFTELLGSVPLVLWMTLTVYAAIACIWTPFQLSGVKMVGYLYCYAVLAGVFLEGWNQGRLTSGLVAAALWISLAMGAAQTFLLGNEYGKSLPGLHDDRFTSFCSPQLFGAFLLAMLSIIFVTSRLPWWLICIHGVGGSVGIVLCGSRYVFLGSIIFLVVVWISHLVRQSTSRALRFMQGVFCMMLLVVLLVGLSRLEPTNRISELVAMITEGRSPLDNIGTLVWRRGIYEQAWNNLTQRGPLELVFGSGTSSGATVVLGWDRRYTEDRVDANRVVHNELLRILFEWGALGLALFGVFLFCLTKMFLQIAVRCRVIPAYAFFSLLPTVVLGCFSENVLAGSASPAGVGFLLSMMYGISFYSRRFGVVNPREPVAIKSRVQPYAA